MGNCFSIECKFCPDVNLNVKLDEIVDTCCPRGGIEILRTKMENLRALKMEVETEIANNRTARVEVRKEVENWIEDVGKLVEELSTIFDTYDAKGMSCCFICSNYNCDIRRKTRLAEAKIQQKASWKDDRIFVPRPPRTAILDHLPTDIVGMKEVLWQLLEFLKDDKVRIVGILGMGGAGKTTLAKQLVQILHSSSTPSATETGGEEAGMFDVIIWAVVSQQQDKEKLQQAIAKELNLHESGEFKDKDVDTRARFLSSYLSARRFLLVLDDVWKEIDLGSIGVPTLDAGKKIVLTTREEKVCADMNARNSTMKVGCLGEEDSWELFRRKIQWDDKEFKSNGIYEIAREIVRKCHGLPLVLITIARAMATKSDIHAWMYAKEELKKSPHHLRGMEDVYELLEFSYNNLESEECQSCLLYSTLFPEDEQISIAKLVDLFIYGDNCCNNSPSSDDITYLRGKGRFIITELIDACLLERGKDEDYVKVHDAIRDMILVWFRKEKRGRRILSYVGKGLSGRFDVNVEEWGAASMVSLSNNHIEELRIEEEEDHRMSTAQCSGKVENIPHRSNSLHVLLLTLNKYMNFPRSLYQHFPNLRVLDFSMGNIKVIPTCLCSLKMLQYLNLSWTPVEILPNEMSNLKNLLQLDLSFTRRLCEISDGLFSSLSKLQSLNLCNSNFFASQCPDDTEKQLQVWKEVGHLLLLKDVRLTNNCDVDTVKFLVDGSDSLSNSITVLGIWMVDIFKDGLFKRMGSRLKRLSWLDMDEFGNGEDLGIDGRHFPELNKLIIRSGDGIVELIGPSQLEGCGINHHHQAILPKLKSIELYNLPNLVRISSSQLRLHSLKEVRIRKCPSLEDISMVVSQHNVEIRCPEYQWRQLEWKNSGGAPPPNFIHISRPVYRA